MTIPVIDHPAENRPAVCRGCPQEDQCRTVWSQPSQSNLSGGRLVLAVIAGFLLPLATAAVGAVIMYYYVGPPGEHSWLDALGALIGLVVGVFPAAWLVRVVNRASRSGD
ncbi:MAG: hypothetical protein JW709_12515 [Sedimentisphaerales bacterium]|nr:hypothetical protein [Sedimentisphaerales bacterium]